MEVPKEDGKVRQLSIPSIRDRVVQGALKLILEPIFEADFRSGFRRIRSRQGRWMPLRMPKAKKRTTLLGKLRVIFRSPIHPLVT